MLKVKDRVWSFSLDKYGEVIHDINKEEDIVTDYPIVVLFESGDSMIEGIRQLYTEDGKLYKFNKNTDLYKKSFEVPSDCKIKEELQIQVIIKDN